MGSANGRLNVTLDDEHAAKLTRIAERTHLLEGTLARSLLSQAIDEADVDPRDVVRILDGIASSFERAEVGRRQAEVGETTPLDEL